MKDASDLPRIAEPWFLALNASIEATPAMVAEDLQKAAPAIEQAVKGESGPLYGLAAGCGMRCIKCLKLLWAQCQ
jgi:hypothetical protein